LLVKSLSPAFSSTPRVQPCAHAAMHVSCQLSAPSEEWHSHISFMKLLNLIWCFQLQHPHHCIVLWFITPPYLTPTHNQSLWNSLSTWICATAVSCEELIWEFGCCRCIDGPSRIIGVQLDVSDQNVLMLRGICTPWFSSLQIQLQKSRLGSLLSCKQICLSTPP
jgi:hypothetical protein